MRWSRGPQHSTSTSTSTGEVAVGGGGGGSSQERAHLPTRPLAAVLGMDSIESDARNEQGMPPLYYAHNVDVSQMLWGCIGKAFSSVHSCGSGTNEPYGVL